MAESVKAIAAIKVLASWLNLDVELMLTGLRDRGPFAAAATSPRRLMYERMADSVWVGGGRRPS
jgi:hypothetical protein